MKLEIINCDFSICKISSIEQANFAREYVFVAKTPDEISLVCETEYAPPNAIAEHGWRAFRVAGALDFDMVGVIAKISNLLAAAGISLFVVSTYNTDYVLLKVENFDRGVQVLVENGYV